MSYHWRKKTSKVECLPFKASDLLRFFRLVRVEQTPPPGFDDPCWMWTGHCDDKGYGQFWIAGRARWAHRVSYRMFKGKIPAGLTVEHRCRASGCVHPRHLTLLSQPKNSSKALSEDPGPAEGEEVPI